MFAAPNKNRKTSSVIRRKSAESTQNSRAPNSSTLQLSRLIRNASIQPKLKVGPANDRFEQEADGMADRVMTSPDPAAALAPQLTPVGAPPLQRQEEEEETAQPKLLQRQEEAEEEVQAQPQEEEEEELQPQLLQRQEEEEEEVQAQPEEEEETVQRQGEEEETAQPKLLQRQAEDEEETVQRQGEEEELQAKAGPGFQRSVPASVEGAIRSSKGGGTPLSPAVQARMEGHFGADFSSVRLHSDTPSVQMNRAIGAQAFTHGSHIYFNSGKLDQQSSGGQRLLAHELTHVVQQGAAPQMQAEPVRTSPEQVQRLPGFITDRLASYARHVPGYTLMTVIIGHDPLAGRAVPRTAENLVGGLMGLIPLGTMLYDKLVEHGIIGRALNFVRGELNRYNLTLARLEQTVRTAWDEMDFIRLDPFAYNLRVLRRHLGQLVSDVRGFAGSLARQLVTMVKEALLAGLRRVANALPGYSLLTKILRRDPLTGEAVEASTAQIIEEFLILIGQRQHLEKMRETGTIARVAAWIDQQLALLNFSFAEIRALFSQAWDAFTIRDLASPIAAFRRTVGIFAPFVGRVARFAWNVATAVLRFIKDALLAALTRFAQRVPGFTLLTVILGRNPFTGETVARNATNLVRGFLEFVPGGREKFRNLQESGALERAFAWISEKVAQFLDIMASIRAAFSRLWQSFSIRDIFNPIGAFERVVNLFRSPVRRILNLAAEVGMKILEFIFAGVMGAGGTRVLNILKQARATFMTIIRDPVGFIRNLISAVMQGFRQFSRNILTHLQAGLVGWLFGALEGAGLQLPERFDLRGIVSLVLQILGLTYERIRPRLVRLLGERTVGILERTFAFVRLLVTEGPAAAWQKILEFAGNIRDRIFDAIRNWVISRVIRAAVTRLATMFNPVGAVIQAILGIYNTIMFFIERINQILALVESITNSISRIAAGAIGAAANFVEQSMARTIPVIISFLARLLGLGGISTTIRNIIARIRRPIDRAIDRIVDWIGRQARRLVSRVRGGAGGAADPDAVKAQARQDLMQEIRGRRFRDVRELDAVVGRVYRRHRPNGLRSLDVRADPEDAQQRVRFVFAASPEEETVVNLSDLFDVSRADNPEEWAAQLPERVGTATETSYAALSVNGRPVDRIASSGSVTQAERAHGGTFHAHAEQRIVYGTPWAHETQQAARRAVGVEPGSSESTFALAINRTPCHQVCVESLRGALLNFRSENTLRGYVGSEPNEPERRQRYRQAQQSGLASWVRGKVRFILSALGLYRGTFGETTSPDLSSLRSAGWTLRVHRSEAGQPVRETRASGEPRQVEGQPRSEADRGLTDRGVILRRLITAVDRLFKNN